MRTQNHLARTTTAAMGVAAIVAMLISYALLEALRPKTVAFVPLTAHEEGLINYVGIGYLVAFLFCILATVRIMLHMRRSQRLTLFHLVALAAGIAFPLMIFGDIALLNDIGNQYESGLSQPEWPVLYTVMAVQIAAILILLYASQFTLHDGESEEPILRDSSIYLLAQYVGFICGGTGFVLTCLNFLYPRPLWMIQQQVTITLIVLITPYVLMFLLWIAVKWREGGKWFDEKQRQDVGASSLIAMTVTFVAMGVVFVVSLVEGSSLIAVLWFPLYTYVLLFSFSAVTIYFGRDAISLTRSYS